jgi:hypothetical protein
MPPVNDKTSKVEKIETDAKKDDVTKKDNKEGEKDEAKQDLVSTS